MDLDWRQRRTIAVLSTILAILVVLVLIVGGVRYRQLRQTGGEAGESGPEGAVLSSQYPYTALSYDNGSATLSFAVDADSGQWYWADDPDFPLDGTTVNTICNLLTELKPQQTLTAEEDLDSYGLESPRATLTATRGDVSVLTLAFGKATTDGTSYYAAMDGDEDTLYIFADTLYQQMSTAIYDMMELPQLPVLTEESIQSITLEGAVSTVLTAQRDEADETTAWRCGGKDVTEDPAVKALLEDLEGMTLVKCVDYKPSDQAVALCGFDEPAAGLQVIYRTEAGTEQSLSVSIGAQALGGDGYYARINSDSTVYLVASESVDGLLAAAAGGLGS